MFKDSKLQAATAGELQKSINIRDLQNQFKTTRKQMEQNEDVKIMMQGLRGSQMSDQEFADQNVVMELVEVQRDLAGDELPLTYDPELIKNYWMRRPTSVINRIFQLLRISGGYISKLISDAIQKKMDQNQVKRAIELRNILTSLGPAYIKLGQALSIRPDVLGPAAMNEMQKLCDKVPEYPTDIAMKLIKEELGKDPQELFIDLSKTPIAAASLGQVYKGRIRATGEEVAVKVQRPYVLETVTVDLFIIRYIGLVLKKNHWITSRFDVVGLLDEWATGFFRELDYVQEGLNGELFAKQIQVDLPQVCVPKTFADYTSRRVLTTGWINGEKLAQSQAGDVGDLVNIGVVCYLKQLLETGFFHADPHPGNLFRTPDGRLGILDFGLMAQIDSDIKYGIIEAIAHLVNKDYELILQDFVTLKFIPPDTDLKPILPTIARVLDQALEGGGAKNLNFQELAADLAQVTFDYPFQIPPYFALIIRAIGVLEGIALNGNPDFAIVDEAYPYVSKRLLTDKTDRLQKALRYLLYGKAGILNADRLIELLDAFEKYDKSSKSGMGDYQKVLPTEGPIPNGEMVSFNGFQNIPFFQQQMQNFQILGVPFTQLVSNLGQGFNNDGRLLTLNGQSSNMSVDQKRADTRIALKFLFSEEGSVFREFLITEIVKSVDALSRDQMKKLIQSLNLSGIRLPILLPGAKRQYFNLAPSMTQEDHNLIINFAKIFQFLSASRGNDGQGSLNQLQSLPSPQVAQEIAPYLPSLAIEIFPELAGRLAGRVTARLTREIFY